MKKPFDNYLMDLAKVIATRSSDPHRKVGAVAATYDNRIIATGYNGTAPGFKESKDFYADRDARRFMMIHAEQNLCSLFARTAGVKTVAVTLSPCVSCATLLASHGVKRVLYCEEYGDFKNSRHVLRSYGITVEKIK